jgi:hypothetical protein
MTIALPRPVPQISRVLGFKPKRTIEDAVRDLARAFRNHLLPNSFEEDWYYNVRTMKKIGARERKTDRCRHWWSRLHR